MAKAYKEAVKEAKEEVKDKTYYERIEDAKEALHVQISNHHTMLTKAQGALEVLDAITKEP